MNRLTTIELYEERFKFSVAHFTIFSATHRERLHGHNYKARAFITAEVQDIGLSFDYAIYKKKLIALCEQLDIYVLLPGQSEILKITESGPHYIVTFNQETMQFLKTDVLILPLRNITLEELSRWFLEQIIADEKTLRDCKIKAITTKISNGDGRDGSCEWVCDSV